MDRRTISTRKSSKRKLEQDSEPENQDRHKIPATDTAASYESHQKLTRNIQTQVDILNSSFSSLEADRDAAKRATSVLSQFAKTEDLVDTMVDCGAVPALVMHLQAPPPTRGENGPKLYEHEVEKGSALALGLLAVKPEHQQLIVDAGALTHLVELLKRHKNADNSRAVNGAVRKAADAITNLAHENSGIKTRVRIEGAISYLVELLEHADTKVQRAAAGALRTLAFKNDENKNQIVECNALPTLVMMLRSEDTAIHYEAVGVIGNLVHSSPHIKKAVLLAGALQPVIGLLSSPCSESQREAALLLGQFAAADSDCKVHIVQRGAVKPLIDMLESSDVQLKEMAAFALGRLAQETHNQAGIAHNGGIVPLLRLLDSKSGPLQHNAAFTLYGLVDNEDNVADLIKVGGFQKLQDGEFIIQQTKDCVAKTMRRLEEKIHGRVLNHLLYLMRVAERNIQRRVALALAYLCAPDDRKVVFIDKNGLDLLLGLLESGSVKLQCDGSVALYRLATKASSVFPVDAAPLSPTSQVYLGEQYVNNPTLSDVTFLVEGKRLYAHRICLLASSDAFRAMFDGGYRERNAKDVEIPNIRWDVFELMMRFIYTGSVEINIDLAQDLLRAADQYLLDGLKRLCECTIAQDISVENVSLMYELSEGFNAMSLRESCILFILKQFDKLCTKPWSSHLIQRIMPDVRRYFEKALGKPTKLT
uniref:BTB domain-containing protein n=1 Tax=Salix viminalis TaxID=40686 RepID=A0A6N2KM75_SALVM